MKMGRASGQFNLRLVKKWVGDIPFARNRENRVSPICTPTGTLVFLMEARIVTTYDQVIVVSVVVIPITVNVILDPSAVHERVVSKISTVIDDVIANG
jgi:hypothetical protein